ncbi:MAG: type I secretion system permease/ATPase [Pontibacterium sp.]
MTMSQDTPHFSELNKVAGTSRKSFIYVGLFSLFINLIMLAPPLYMLQVYDRVMASRSQETLLVLTLILVWMFFTMGILELVRARILARFSNRLDDALSKKLHQSMMRTALNSPGQASVQPVRDLSAIRQFFSGNAPFAFFDIPWIPVYITVLFLFDPWFGWFSLFAAAVLMLLALLNHLSTHKLQKQAAEKQVTAGKIIAEQMRNAEVLHAMGMQNALEARWLKEHRKGGRAQSQVADRAATWSTLSKTLRLLFQSLMLGLGAWLAINNQITAGMVIAGSIIMARALAPIDQMIGAWKSFSAARSAYRNLDVLLIKNPDAARRLSLPDPTGQLAVSNAVLMADDGETALLKGIGFSLRAGETLAVIGSSGAGKTSLVRAMIGLLPLSAGEVRLDGADIQHWNMDELGPQIGYLPQDVELFAGTVAENIARFGMPDHARIVQAAQMADVDHLIRGLPGGYDTAIGIAGTALSGGQRQRIGLARALYGNPKIVVLDEPNASLDEKGESALASACRLLKAQKVTLIIISHRQSIVTLADKLLLLEAGRQQLFGPTDAVQTRMAAARKMAVPQTHMSAAQTEKPEQKPVPESSL